MISLVETILYNFSDFSISLLEGVPNHKYLTYLNSYLIGYAASVHFNLGNGTVGYLLIIAPSTVFAITCVIPFVPPVNPGPTVTTPNPPLAVAVIGACTRSHDKELHVFNEYYNTDKDFKKVLLSLISESY